MLSQENIDKLHMNGIYRCDPVLEWLPSYKRNVPYWCRNWTFRVKEYKGQYVMYDTYWSTGDDYPVELTDENFDKFEYLFDIDKIRFVSVDDWFKYPEKDRFRVALDSGGINYPSYVVKEGSKKSKEMVVKKIQEKIDCLEEKLKLSKQILEKILNDEIDYDFY